jgi:hypothetical protein
MRLVTFTVRWLPWRSLGMTGRTWDYFGKPLGEKPLGIKVPQVIWGGAKGVRWMPFPNQTTLARLTK